MIFDLRKSLLILSLIGILNIISIRAYAYKYKRSASNHDQSIFFDENIRKYDKQNVSTKFGSTSTDIDGESLAQLALHLEPFHHHLTSMIFAERPNQNIIYSPISISTLLTMASFGAKGSTLFEILKYSGLPVNKIAIDGFQSLINRFKQAEGVNINFANKMFASDTVSLKPTFQYIVTKNFESKPETLDFYDIDNAVDTINNWCREQTDNQIDDIITADDLQGGILMVLLNAIYFNGTWATPFDSKFTSDAPFKIDNNTVVNVPTMYVNGMFNSGSVPGLKAYYVELPYESKNSDQFSMYIMMPIAVDGLNEIEKNIHLIDFKQLNNKNEEIILRLPKFKLGSKLELKSILQKMGIRKIFMPNANFGEIVENVELHISRIMQNAFIEIDEKGSTASAATGMDFADRFGPSLFQVNRPFLCAIVMKKLGIPLFYARIVNPTEK